VQEVGEGYVWVVDPIDGTSNFARGIPHFAVCIGLLKDGVPILGAVYNPITRELYHAKQTGAYLNGAKITVTSEVHLSDATVLLHIGRTEAVRAWGLALQEKFLSSAKKTINLGSSALDLCYLASGRVDGVIYGTMSLRDVASAALIVRMAGGEIYNYDTGLPAELLPEPQKIIATGTRALRDEIVG
jgi:myo-inositol-1(or 4)-monophosphatase